MGRNALHYMPLPYGVPEITSTSPAMFRCSFGPSAAGAPTTSPSDLLYIVLDWLNGVPLNELETREGGWELDELLRLFTPIEEALALCHEAGVAHRDIKPSKVFALLDSGQVELRLLDFGIAKVAEDRPGGFQSTATGTSMFTLAYAAPEQLRGAPTGPWTDVYALAMVLSVLLAGRHPYRGTSALEKMIRITDGSRRPTPRALDATVTEDVDTAFAAALAVDPNERVQDVKIWWQMLTAAHLGA